MSNIDESAGGQPPPDRTSAQAYTEDSIEVLECLEAVRRRPGMYFGSTGPKGQLQAVLEAIDNVVDEHLAGFATTLMVSRDDNGWFTIADDGGGIPNAAEPRIWEAVFGTLHFSRCRHDEPYHVHSGPFGVGIAALNAVCLRFAVRVEQAGRCFEQTFHRGEPMGEPIEMGRTTRSGTRLRFVLDPEIFEGTFPTAAFTQHLRTIAALNPRLAVHLDGEDCSEPEGLVGYGRAGRADHAMVLRSRRVWVRIDGVDLQVATLQSMPHEPNFAFDSLSVWVNHGVIEKGSPFRPLNAWLHKERTSGRSTDVLVGMLLPTATYEGRIKSELNNPEVEPLVARILRAMDAVPRHLETLLDGSAERTQVLLDWAQQNRVPDIVEVLSASNALRD
ncbi:MAG: ATP-binding protein [Myxococcota bacterium]